MTPDSNSFEHDPYATATPPAMGQFDTVSGGASLPTKTLDTTGPYLESKETTPAAQTLRIGRYEILAEIARGGMGVVYKAFDSQLDRTVALKLIKSGELADHDQIERFQTEAKAAAQLDHPGIVPVYEVGEFNSLHFLTMAFVDGHSLWQEVKESPLAPKHAAKLMQQVAEAIQFAHDRGIVHRDLKPQNILLAKDGQPKVTDFGLAKRCEHDGSLTQTGQALGTPSYMPPEQAQGKIKDIGALADVYSLGATLYFLLTGRPPFQAATQLETMLQVVEQEPVSPRLLNPTIPRDLDTICLKCLQKEQVRRYDSAQALANELQRFLGGEPILARPVGLFERGWRWCRRSPVVAGTLGLAALLLIAVGVVSTVAYVRESRMTERLSHEVSRTAEANWAAREQLYSAQIARASAELAAGNHSGAELALESVPFDQRGWEYRYLWRQAQGTPLTLRGHDNAVNAVAFSPDGVQLASASSDRTIKLWDGTSGAELKTFRGHAAKVSSLSFSPDGLRIASASADGKVKLWDVRSGAEIQSLSQPGTPLAFNSVSFSPDGRFVAGANVVSNVVLWNAATGDFMRMRLGSRLANYSLCFKPDGEWIAIASNVGGYELWNPETGQDHPHPAGNSFLTMRCVCFSPDGRRLAGGAIAQGIIISDATTGEELQLLGGHAGKVNVITYSPEGRLIASASDDQTVQLWDARTGSQIGTLRGHTNAINAICFSPDGLRLASAAEDQTIKLWDRNPTAASSVLRGHDGEVRRVRFSPDGQFLASAASDSSVRLWDARSHDEVKAFRVQTDQRPGLDPKNLLRFHPSGTRLLTSAYDLLDGWDTASGEKAYSCPLKAGMAKCLSPDGSLLARLDDFQALEICDTLSGQRSGAPLKMSGVQSPIMSAAFSPVGNRLATAGGSGLIVQLWDVKSGKELPAPSGHTSPVLDLSFSPDGMRLASTSWDQDIKLWDLGSGSEVATIHGREALDRSVNFHANDEVMVRAAIQGILNDLYRGGWTNSLSFNAAGTRFAFVAVDQVIRLCDGKTGNELQRLRGHVGKVNSLCFSPDGSLLASASEDQTIKLWNTRDGSELLTLRGHAGSVNFLDFNSEGTLLASASSDKSIRLWDTRAGEESMTLLGHADLVTDTKLSPDGRLLFSASRDQSIKSWDVATGENLHTFHGHTAAINSVALNPNGQILASTSEDKTIRLWDVQSGKELRILQGHSGGVSCVSFNRNGSQLASASIDGTIRLWQADSGKLVQTIGASSGSITSLRFNSDGTQLAGREEFGKIKHWEIPGGKALEIPQHESQLDFGKDVKVSRDQRILRGAAIQLVRRNPSYDPWAEDAKHRIIQAATTHAAEAASAEKEDDWYTAAFHLGWLLKEQPNAETLNARYDRTLTKLKELRISPPKLPLTNPAANSK